MHHQSHNIKNDLYKYEQILHISSSIRFGRCLMHSIVTFDHEEIRYYKRKGKLDSRIETPSRSGHMFSVRASVISIVSFCYRSRANVDDSKWPLQVEIVLREGHEGAYFVLRELDPKLIE